MKDLEYIECIANQRYPVSMRGRCAYVRFSALSRNAVAWRMASCVIV